MLVLFMRFLSLFYGGESSNLTVVEARLIGRHVADWLLRMVGCSRTLEVYSWLLTSMSVSVSSSYFLRPLLSLSSDLQISLISLTFKIID